MSGHSKQMLEIAQSEMSRNALSHWTKFKLPEPNEKIDALIGKLAEASENEPPERDHSRWRERSRGARAR